MSDAGSYMAGTAINVERELLQGALAGFPDEGLLQRRQALERGFR